MIIKNVPFFFSLTLNETITFSRDKVKIFDLIQQNMMQNKLYIRPPKYENAFIYDNLLTNMSINHRTN